MNLQQQSKLESMLGKCWMYKGNIYTLNDFQQIGEKVLIGTDIKTLSLKSDQVADFVKECLPVENKPAIQNSGTVSIPGVEANYFSELASGLMTSFREIQGAKDEKFLKEATSRAAAKVQISKAVTDIAKTVIAGQKAIRGKE